MKKFGKRKDEPRPLTQDPTEVGSAADGKKSAKGKASAGVKVVKQAIQDTAIEYIKSGNTEALEKMAEEGSEDVKFLNRLHTKSGKSPLCVAAEEGRIASMTILLKAKADVNLVDKSGMTAFLYAGTSGELEILEMLQEAEADVHARTTARHENALFLAAASNHLKCVELLIVYGLTFDDKNKQEETALSTALKFEYFPICTYLVERGADINVRGANGSTPLMRAAFAGRIQTAEFIVKNGGEVNLTNCNGETALSIACRHDRADIVNLLLRSGAEVDLPDQSGRTPLMFCCMVGKNAMIGLLVESGASVTAIDQWGYSALMYSCIRNTTNTPEDQMVAHIATVEFLLQNGALIDQMDKNYNTSLMHCCKKGHLRVACVLLELGADPTLRTMDDVATCDLIANDHDRALFIEATKSLTGLNRVGGGAGTRAMPEWIKLLNSRRKK
jgi:ankyrin repeat protein